LPIIDSSLIISLEITLMGHPREARGARGLFQ
jgi:hypothetical protein